MRPFRCPGSSASPPEGWQLLLDPERPDPATVNALLCRCGQPRRSDARIALALERSDLLASLWDLGAEPGPRLIGVLRATSDQSLNVNLWDLCVDPALDPCRETALHLLLEAMLRRLRRDLPGCSISLAAAAVDLPLLHRFGFQDSPNGIRAMGIRP